MQAALHLATVASKQSIAEPLKCMDLAVDDDDDVCGMIDVVYTRGRHWILSLALPSFGYFKTNYPL